MQRVVGLFGLLLLVAGCGGTAGKAGAPKEDPAAVMVRLEQREAINRDLYVHCPAGFPTTDVKVEVKGVRDAVFDVPALGKVSTKAVSFEMSVIGADGKRIMVPDTGHLIAQDGHWRWTLSRRSFSALLAGACP